MTHRVEDAAAFTADATVVTHGCAHACLSQHILHPFGFAHCVAVRGLDYVPPVTTLRRTYTRTWGGHSAHIYPVTHPHALPLVHHLPDPMPLPGLYVLPTLYAPHIYVTVGTIPRLCGPRVPVTHTPPHRYTAPRTRSSLPRARAHAPRLYAFTRAHAFHTFTALHVWLRTHCTGLVHLCYAFMHARLHTHLDSHVYLLPCYGQYYTFVPTHGVRGWPHFTFVTFVGLHCGLLRLITLPHTLIWDCTITDCHWWTFPHCIC